MVSSSTQVLATDHVGLEILQWDFIGLVVDPVTVRLKVQRGRIFIEGLANIPVEDLAYNMLMLLMNVSIYEYLEKRRPSLAPVRKR